MNFNQEKFDVVTKLQEKILRHTYFITNDGKHFIEATEEQARAFERCGGIIYNGNEERVHFNDKYYRCNIHLVNSQGDNWHSSRYIKAPTEEAARQKTERLFNDILQVKYLKSYQVVDIQIAEVTEDEYYDNAD